MGLMPNQTLTPKREESGTGCLITVGIKTSSGIPTVSIDTMDHKLGVEGNFNLVNITRSYKLILLVKGKRLSSGFSIDMWNKGQASPFSSLPWNSTLVGRASILLGL